VPLHELRHRGMIRMQARTVVALWWRIAAR
jgi:hypothetical protein